MTPPPSHRSASVSGRLKPKYEAAVADTAEADPYGAIARAALGIRDVEGPRKLVVIDSKVTVSPKEIPSSAARSSLMTISSERPGFRDRPAVITGVFTREPAASGARAYKL